MKIIYLRRPGWWLAAILAGLLVLSLLLATWCVPHAPASAGPEDTLAGKVVLLDPGHGGFDPGAVAADGTHEDALNLAISLCLAKSLDDRGAKVIMTRMSADALGHTKREDMDRRLKLTSDSGADLVISVHMNHFPEGRYFGTQVFYRTDDSESERLATLIQDTVRDTVDPDNTRLCKPSTNYGILNTAKTAAVLIECGFMSNQDELARLKDAAYQQRLADAIAEGVAAYYELPPEENPG